MLIGLCGGICSGKSSIASYLIEQHQFKRIYLARTTGTPSVEKSASNAHVPSTHSKSSEEHLTFSTTDSLLEFVTLRWRERWVTTDIWDEQVVDSLLRRPFFLLVGVDAPVSVRWQRFKARCAAHKLTPPTLEDFVIRNDEHLYAPGSALGALSQRAQLKLLNSSTSIYALNQALEGLNLPNDARLRPSWDQYFMQLADLAAHRSNCMKRRVGCVIVREKRVISTGYNGTPRGMTNCNEGGCPRCNNASRAGMDLSTCLCLHAEENALLEAGRDRIGEKSILYCNTCPCLTCSVKITQVGISEVVYNQGYLVDTQTAAIFAESGVRLRQFSPPRAGVVDLSVDANNGEGGTSWLQDEYEHSIRDVRRVLDDEKFIRPIK
ncbi:hypothetical protein P154DRAFT_562652 [Amniculicola lignicola CBS 123094]|uniref:Deoxycytidylate deaminase n=1 Tax=Amniculicola lignicola CBS 123094 TaxID=1392246 RepID=A0A6A5WIQ0_9PLEO|nr:hypothetical protein P154DRAFT_562652 [Amniculicola lignicola CBS 123094]